MGAAAERAEVLIVGAGIIGLACAEALSRAGRGVTVIDRAEIGHGASWANCGLITPSHGLPLAIPGATGAVVRGLWRGDAPFHVKPRFDLALFGWCLRFCRAARWSKARRTMVAKHALLSASRRALAELIERERFECEWTEAGLLLVYRDRATFEAGEEHDRHLAEVGIHSERIGGDRLTQREPALRSGLAGGRHYTIDAHLRPDRLIAELVRVLRARGVTLLETCEALRFEGDRGGSIARVQTSAGPIACQRLVIATGAWTPRLDRALGLTLPIQPGKGYTITAEAPPAAPRVPLILTEPSVAITPWREQLRIGSTMEFAGYDSSLNPRRLAAIERGAREFLRPESLPHAWGRADRPGASGEAWYGWRPMTPDDLPFIGPAPGWDNVLVAAGHGMLGTSTCAGTAALVAAMITGDEPPFDPRPYALRR